VLKATIERAVRIVEAAVRASSQPEPA